MLLGLVWLLTLVKSECNGGVKGYEIRMVGPDFNAHQGSLPHWASVKETHGVCKLHFWHRPFYLSRVA